MSIYFIAKDGHDLWNPAAVTARLFWDQAESVGRIISIETGLGPIISDEVIVDDARFKLFVGAFADFILKLDRESGGRALAETCFGIAGALAQKLGGISFSELELVRLIEGGRRIVG